MACSSTPGDSFPCVDPEPYGAEETSPSHYNTIIHDSEWGLKATADFGIIRNVGESVDAADYSYPNSAFSLGLICY